MKPTRTRQFLMGVFVLLALAGTSNAQTLDACDGPLNPYVQNGDPSRAARCAEAQLRYVPLGGCVKPYADAATFLCDRPITRAALPAGHALAPLRSYTARSVIVQASIGQPERELAYVVLLNIDDAPQDVVVEYAIEGRQGTHLHTRTLAPKERHAIGLHEDPAFAGRLNFSATAYFTRVGAMELTWLRASDFAEMGSKPGVGLDQP